MIILLLAYASEPGAGSEYGVGWMVPTTMAKRYPEHEVYVLTRSRCKDKIEDALDAHGYKNLHFLFYDIPKWLTYPNEMKSRWGEQINYLQWQIYARRYIRQQHRKIGFDVVHHLTFNQYRTPSPGYWMDIPFVVGPVGGAECIAPAFWQDLDKHTQKKEKIRQKGRDLKIFRWFISRSANKKVILFSGKENYDRLKKCSGDNQMEIMPAIGFSPDDFSPMISSIYREEERKVPFTMIYAGKAWDWKGILIFLRSLNRFKSQLSGAKFQVKLIGIRFEEEQQQVLGWVNELGLQDNVELIPFIQRSELLKMEAGCDLSVYPAFRDSGSMSILEACALGCPSICFNAGGQDIFPDEIMLKIPIKDTYDECMNLFAEKLLWAYTHQADLKAIGLKSKDWVEEHLTWNRKVDDFIQIYKQLAQ